MAWACVIFIIIYVSIRIRFAAIVRRERYVVVPLDTH